LPRSVSFRGPGPVDPSDEDSRRVSPVSPEATDVLHAHQAAHSQPVVLSPLVKKRANCGKLRDVPGSIEITKSLPPQALSNPFTCNDAAGTSCEVRITRAVSLTATLTVLKPITGQVTYNLGDDGESYISCLSISINKLVILSRPKTQEEADWQAVLLNDLGVGVAGVSVVSTPLFSDRFFWYHGFANADRLNQPAIAEHTFQPRHGSTTVGSL
jgi:hypothetical protein